MRFGVLLDHQYPAGDDLGRRIDELIMITETARDLGYDSIFGIHHYLAGLQTPQPLMVLSRLIPHSGSMLLGTAVYILPLSHPVQVAEEVATLDQLSGGRLVFGVGAGYRENEFESFGIDMASRGQRLVEGVELLRELWSGETVEHQGRHYTVRGQRISVRPRQTGGPPIWIGANNEATVRRAARIGDGWLVAPSAKERWAIGHRGFHQDELAGVGPPARPPEYVMLRELYLADSDEQARREAGPYLRQEHAEYAQYHLEHFLTMFDDLWRKSILGGTAEAVTTRLRHLGQAGFTHFLFRIFWSGMPVEQSLETLRRFAAEVMPALRQVPDATGTPAS